MNTLEIRKRIENVIDESRHQSLKQLNAIKHIGIDGEKNIVVLIIEIGMLGGDAEKNLKRNLAKIVKVDLNFTGIKIQFQETRSYQNIANKKTKFIIIASGKGGVGKSTVACNLAYALTRLGKKVGLIDADIYGSSLPRALEIVHSSVEVGEDNKIIPFNAFNMEVISTEFFADEGRPIIWRGAILNNMINNFFYQVKWNKNLDYMIIDSPPGTGDVMLDLSKLAPKAEIIVVTTPHLAASHVATKAGIAVTDLKHEIIGIVENMSYYKNPANNKKDFLFGQGGGMDVAKKLSSELLVQIPINQPKHHLSLYESDEEIGKLYDDLAMLVSIRN